jgi:hypothetical protein
MRSMVHTWTKQPKEGIWVLTADGVRSGMHSGVSSQIVSGKEDAWIPDTKRGWGMVRASPCIRTVAFTCVPPHPPFSYGSFHELFISWNKEPALGTETRKKYDADIASGKFIGIHKSASTATTALKQWMLKDGGIIA